MCGIDGGGGGGMCWTASIYPCWNIRLATTTAYTSFHRPSLAIVESSSARSPNEQNVSGPVVQTKTWVLECPNKNCKKLLQDRENMSGKDFLKSLSYVFLARPT